MASPAKLSRTAILSVVAMGMTVGLVSYDFTSMNVALPDIEQDFDSQLTTVQWVLNAFQLAAIIGVVTGGRLADGYGRRRIYFVGAAIFGIASLVGGLAPGIFSLIGARLVMGIGAAILTPAVIGIIYESLPRERAGLAGGIFAGSVGTGQVVGPLLGGAFTTFISWRFVMLFNVPYILIAIFITWRVVRPDPQRDEDQQIDYLGSVLLALGLLALLVSLTQIPTWGLGDTRTLLLMLAAVVLLIAFVILERRIGERALVPREVMDNRQFMMTCLAIVLLSMPFFVALLYLPQFTQKFLGFSAFVAGIALLPMIVVSTSLSFLSGSIYDKIGPKFTVLLGAIALTLGTLLLSIIPDDTGYWWLVPGMLVMGLGIGIFFSAATTAGVVVLGAARRSLGGGIVFMARIIGGTLGIALTTALFTSVSQDDLATQATDANITLTDSEVTDLDGVLVGTDTANEILANFPTQTADQLISLAQDAFVSAFRTGMLVNVLFAFAGIVIALLFVGGPFQLKELEEEERLARLRLSRYLHTPHG